MMQIVLGLFLKLFDALHIGEEIVVTFATVKPIQMIRTICKNIMVWQTVLFATVKPIRMMQIICKKDVVPDRPFCNSQAHPYDPDKSDRPLCNKAASQGKKVMPKS